MEKELHKDAELNLRLFYVLAWTAIIANTIGYISNGLLYGLNHATIFTFVCALIMYAAGAVGMIFRTTWIPGFVILAVCDLVEFPGMYLIYGAARLPYLLLGLVGTVLFMGKKKRVWGAGLVILLDAAVIVWRAGHPEASFVYAQGDNAIAAMMNFVISGVSILVMTIILLQQYEKQQTRLQEMAGELQEMVLLDPLTQLYNRRYLTEYIDGKMKQGDTCFAVALLDIDDFKMVNDTYGHMYGDDTLQALAGILKRTVKGHGIASRFGGEEFMLVFDHADLGVIEGLLNQAQEAFARFGMDTKKQKLSFSGGVEVFHNEDRITKLFNAADEKLYHAKHRGKKQIVYYREEAETEAF